MFFTSLKHSNSDVYHSMNFSARVIKFGIWIDNISKFNQKELFWPCFDHMVNSSHIKTGQLTPPQNYFFRDPLHAPIPFSKIYNCPNRLLTSRLIPIYVKNFVSQFKFEESHVFFMHENLHLCLIFYWTLSRMELDNNIHEKWFNALRMDSTTKSNREN